MDAFFYIRYTVFQITPFGRLTTVKNFFQNSGLRDVISFLQLPQFYSNRGYGPADIIGSYLVRVILGAGGLALTGLSRHKKVVSEIFGWMKGKICH
ncbi:MAG: hypothetical protein ACOYNC_11915 [Bacteroidales bacterium]